MSKPTSIRQYHGSTPVVDIERVFSELEKVEIINKSIAMLALAGCESWDEQGRYIKGACISLVGIGGLPISSQLLTLQREQGKVVMASSAAMSYLNSGGKNLESLYALVVDKGHYSIAHTATVNLLVAGASTGVENEFNSQRDLLHMSRLTTARTGIQQKPPIMVPSEELYGPTRQITEYIDGTVANITPTDLNSWEERNLLYPTSKATLFIATASLRNFQKLVAQSTDNGKEREYRAILNSIDKCLGTLWPELFSSGERTA